MHECLFQKISRPSVQRKMPNRFNSISLEIVSTKNRNHNQHSIDSTALLHFIASFMHSFTISASQKVFLRLPKTHAMPLTQVQLHLLALLSCPDYHSACCLILLAYFSDPYLRVLRVVLFTVTMLCIIMTLEVSTIDKGDCHYIAF